MTVMARETWTDKRLDDLNKRVDEGFNETRHEFRALRGEMQAEFQAQRGEMKGEFQAVRGEMFQAVRGEMKGEFQAVRGEMKGEFPAVQGEMQALHRTSLAVMISGFATMLVGFGGTIATILLTQS